MLDLLLGLLVCIVVILVLDLLHELLHILMNLLSWMNWKDERLLLDVFSEGVKEVLRVEACFGDFSLEVSFEHALLIDILLYSLLTN